jgi:cell division protein FtsA
VTKHFDSQITITKEIVDDLINENVNTNMGDRNILEIIPQEYGVGPQKQLEPVGVLSDYIEGRFLNIISRSSLRTNIDNCFAKVGIHVVEDKLIPLTVANEVLSDTEKRSGCVLVDFGADTTTVSIYKGNLLRFISVIPLGSANITKDIMSCQLEEKEAEELKLNYGEASTSDLTEEEGKTVIYTLPDGSGIERKRLGEIIEARSQEILYNVREQILASGFGRESLVAGAWLIGGGSGLKGLAKSFTEITNFDKVKIVRNSLNTIHYGKNVPKETEGHFLAAISLLVSGKQACTSAMIPGLTDGGIFTTKELEPAPEPEPIINKPATETDIQDTDEEEEHKAKKHKEPKIHKPKGPSFLKKLGDKVKNFSKEIVGDE